jgi:hypothetical protein
MLYESPERFVGVFEKVKSHPQILGWLFSFQNGMVRFYFCALRKSFSASSQFTTCHQSFA